MQDGVTLIGHVCIDIIRMPGTPARQQPGGGVYYAGMALRALGMPVEIITRCAPCDEVELVAPLHQAGASVTVLASPHSTGFVNSYGPGVDDRTQQITSLADPFTIDAMPSIATRAIYFGPLTNNEIPAALIKHIAGQRQHLIALDAQGFVRRVEHQSIQAANWTEKSQILPLVDILHADIAEAAILTGTTHPEIAARRLCEMGVKHALVTLGGEGSALCHNGELLRLPAWRPTGRPWHEIDSTGCGDTFLAAYLYARMHGQKFADAGRFASVATAHKLSAFGPLQTRMQTLIAAMTA